MAMELKSIMYVVHKGQIVGNHHNNTNIKILQLFLK